MRLSKFLAYCGVASRRKTKDLILQGKVKINGKVVCDLSYQVDPEKDVVEIDGKRLIPPPKVYYLFYKPRGYMTSLFDPHERKTIAKFLKSLPYRVFPVGRLDKESEGLLLLTNDGDLAHSLLHPRFEVKRTYLVWVKPKLDKTRIEELLKNGVIIEDKKIRPLVFEKLKSKKNGICIYKVVVKEGIKREVRKMVAFLGGEVIKLLRIGFGPLRLKGLKPGEIRKLTEEEKRKLFEFIEALQEKSSSNRSITS